MDFYPKTEPEACEFSTSDIKDARELAAAMKFLCYKFQTDYFDPETTKKMYQNLFGNIANFSENVKKLVEDIINNRITPEIFVSRLARPKWGLPKWEIVNMLKRSLPLLKERTFKNLTNKIVNPILAQVRELPLIMSHSRVGT